MLQLQTQFESGRAVARDEVVVEGDAPAVLDDLLGGERRDVLGLAELVEEQLELGDVAELEVLGRGGGEPLAQRVEARTGERVRLAASSAVFHGAGQ